MVCLKIVEMFNIFIDFYYIECVDKLKWLKYFVFLYVELVDFLDNFYMLEFVGFWVIKRSEYFW